MGVIIESIWCDVFVHLYINIKRKSKVDHCGNDVGLTSIHK